MIQLTQKEYDQRALMVMRFVSYYKYTFTFEGSYFDGRKVIASYGGTADDIYRLDVSIHSPWKLEDFEIDDCCWR